jgi:hypothetical protein
VCGSGILEEIQNYLTDFLEMFEYFLQVFQLALGKGIDA